MSQEEDQQQLVETIEPEKREGGLNPDLGNNPCHVKCPYCASHQYTQVEFQNGVNSYLITLLFIILGGLTWSLFVLPLSFILTKHLLHRCSVCQEEIGGNGQIFFISKLKDDIVSFKLGEMGCIMKRSQLITVLLGVLIIITGYFQIGFLFSPPERQSNFIRFPTQDSWEKFISKCGQLQIAQGRQSFYDCQYAYQEKTMMNWDGYIIRVEDNRDSLYKYFSHAVTILIQMDPQESEYSPDLMITMDTYQAQDFEETVEKLERGNHVAFNATLKSIGNTQQVRHFHANNIELIEGNKEIQPHLHDRTRYYMRKDNTNIN